MCYKILYLKPRDNYINKSNYMNCSIRDACMNVNKTITV